MTTDSSQNQISVRRRRPGGLQKQLFTIGWATAVIVATAGWTYLIFRVIWYVVGRLVQ